MAKQKTPPAPNVTAAIEDFRRAQQRGPAADVKAEQELSREYSTGFSAVTNPKLRLDLPDEIFSFNSDPYSNLKHEDYVGTTQDVNYKVGDRQGWVEQWAKAAAKFPFSVALKTAATATDLLGAVTEAGDIATDTLTGESETVSQRLADVYENPFSSALRKADEWLKSDFWKLHSTREYDAVGESEGLGGLLSKMGTAKFWAQDVADGAAYATSAYLTGNALAGLKIGASLGNMFKAGSTATKALTQYGDIALATAVQTLSEAAAEASGVAQSVREKYTGKVNPATGQIYSDDEINIMAGDAGRNTFVANSMVLLLPNIIQSKFFLGGADELVGGAKLMKKAGTMDMAALKASTKGATGKAIGTGIVSEGMWEENIQTAIQNFETDTASDTKGMLETIVGYGKNMVDNFGTTEGLSSIFIGSLIGSVMGGVSQVKENKQALKGAERLIDKFNTNLALYKTEKGVVEDLLSERSKDATNKLLFQSLKKKKLFDAHTAASMRSDTIAKSYLESQALAIQALDYLSSGQFNNPGEAMDFLKWQIETAAKTENADASTYQQDLARYKSLVDKFQDFYTEADSTARAMSSRLGIKEGHREAFIRDYKSAFYGELVKAENLLNQQKAVAKQLNRLGDRQVGNTASLYDTLGKLIEDSNQTLKSFSNPSEVKALADKYSDNVETISSIAKRAEELKGEIEAAKAKRDADIKKAKPVEEKPVTKNDAEKSEEAKTEEEVAGAIGDPVPAEDLIESKEESDAIDKVEGQATTEPTNEPEIQEAKLEEQEIDVKYNELLALQYKMMELQRREGLQVVTDGNNAVLYADQFVAGKSLKARTLTPLRKADEYFFKLGQEVDKLEKLDRLLESFRAGKTTLEDLLLFATSMETIPENQALQIAEAVNEEYDKMNQEIFDNPGSYDIIDPEDDTVQPIRDVRDMKKEESFMLSNPPAYYEMYARVSKIRDLVDQLNMRAESQSKLVELLENPEKARDYVNRMIAEEVYDLPNYIIKAAIDEDGEVKDTYTDSTRVTKAIEDVANRIGAMTHMINNNEGNKEFNIEHRDTLKNYLKMLLYIQDAILDNAQNKNSKQNKIAVAYVEGFNTVLNSINGLDYFEEIADMSLGQLLEEAGTKTPLEGMAIVNGILERLKDRIDADSLADLKAIHTDLVNGMLEKIPSNYFRSMYKANPKDTFAADVLPSILTTEVDGYKDSMTPANSKLLKEFVKSNNVIEFRDALEASDENTRIAKEDALDIIDTHIKIVYLGDLINHLSSSSSLEQVIINELTQGQQLATTDNTPSIEQLIAIRQIASWFGLPNSKTTEKTLDPSQTADKQAASLGAKIFKKIAYLEGVAGTGKTSIVLKWTMKALKLTNNQVVALAPKEKAVEVIGQETGLSASLVHDFLVSPTDFINNETRLIVLDEFGMLTTSEILKLAIVINNINATRPPAEHIKLLMLGDRTQIKQSEALKVFEGTAMASMVKINPLTVPFRTNVGAISDFYNMYQGVTSRVTGVIVSADKPVGQAGATGVHAVKSPEELLSIVRANVESNPDSSKVIIVGNPSQISKYEGIEGVEVLTADNAQSASYDEVYIDIDPSSFKSVSRYNSFMYTAGSRARNYVATIDGTATNTTIPSLVDLAAKEESRIVDNRTEFVSNTKRDLATLQQIKQGKETVVPTTPPVVITPIQEVEGELVEDPDEVPVDNIIVDENEDIINLGFKVDIQPVSEGAITLANPERGVSSLINNNVIKAGDSVQLVATNRTINGHKEKGVVLHRNESGDWAIIGRVFEGGEFSKELGVLTGVSMSDFEIGNAIKGKTAEEVSTLLPSITLEVDSVASRKIVYSSALTTIPENDTIGGVLDQVLEQIYNNGPQAKEARKSFKIMIPNKDVANSTAVGNFRLKPGVPYAVFNQGKSTQVAIRLQPRSLKNTDQIVTDLRAYRDAVLALEGLLPSNMVLGTKGFEELIKIAKAGLTIDNNKVVLSKNSVEDVLAELTRTIATLENSKTVDSKLNGSLSALRALQQLFVEDTQFNIIKGALTVASQFYGPKSETQKMTIKEFNELVAIDPIYEFKPSKDNPEEGYAVEKVTKAYKQVQVVTAGYGPAQLAMNDLAKANRFAGNKIIRTQRVYKRGGKINTVTAGKSLISSSAASEVRSDLVQIAKEINFRKTIKNTNNDLEQYADALKAFVDATFVGERNAELHRAIDNTMNKGITNPVSMDTLNQIVGEDNFSATGEYSNATNPQFTLRVPLNTNEFESINALGLNPEGNKDQLNLLLRSNFAEHTPARVRLVNPAAKSTAPKKEKTDTTPEANIERRSASVEKEIANLTKTLETGLFQVGDTNIIIKLDSNGNFVGYKITDSSGKEVIESTKRPSTEENIKNVNTKRNLILKQLDILNSNISKQLDYLLGKLGPKKLVEFLEQFSFQERGVLQNIDENRISTYYLNNFERLKAIEKQINAKYTAELGALTSNTTQQQEDAIERRRQEIAEEGLQELNKGKKNDEEIAELPLGFFKRIWSALRGNSTFLEGLVDFTSSFINSDFTTDIDKIISGIKVSKAIPKYSDFINELEKQINEVNDKLNERVDKGIRENYPKNAIDKLIKERDLKVENNKKVLQQAKEANAKYDAELGSLNNQTASEQQTQAEESQQQQKAEIVQTNKPTIQTIGNITFGTANKQGQTDNNEDAVYVDTESGIFILADGMGGEGMITHSPSQTSKSVINKLLGKSDKNATELLYEEYLKNKNITSDEAVAFLNKNGFNIKGVGRSMVSTIINSFKTRGDLTNKKGFRTGATALKAVKTGRNTYNIEKVGDTVYFVVDKNGKISQSHGLSDVATTQGYMFSIRDGKPYVSTPKIDSFTVTLNEGETLVLATDFIETDKAIQDFINSDFGKNLNFAEFQKNNKVDDSTFITIKYDAELAALNNQPTSQQEGQVAQQKDDIEKRRQERLTPISEKNPKGYFENTGVYKKDKTTGEEYYDPDTKNGTYSVDFSENEEIDDFIDADSIKELRNKINAKYDAEYVEAVKKGAMTKEQAMKALEEVGRKDSKAYTELSALENTSNTSIKPGVAELFNENPELSSIGTPEQYSQYLETIFPNSKVKDIVYHGTTNTFDKFELGHTNATGKKANTEGFHFIAEPGKSFYKERYGKLMSVLLDIKNPVKDSRYEKALEYLSKRDKAVFKSEGYDSGIKYFEDEDGEFEYVVFEPEQIHILGSQADIQGFQDFVNSKSIKEVAILADTVAETPNVQEAIDIADELFGDELFGDEISEVETISETVQEEITKAEEEVQTAEEVQEEAKQEIEQVVNEALLDETLETREAVQEVIEANSTPETKQEFLDTAVKSELQGKRLKIKGSKKAVSIFRKFIKKLSKAMTTLSIISSSFSPISAVLNQLGIVSIEKTQFIGDITGLSKGDIGSISRHSLTREQQNALTGLIAKADSAGRNYVTYTDYATGQAGVYRNVPSTEEADAVVNLTPEEVIKKLLGQFTFRKLENGNYIITDQYNFNDVGSRSFNEALDYVIEGLKDENLSTYLKIRRVASLLGSPEGEGKLISFELGDTETGESVIPSLLSLLSLVRDSRRGGLITDEAISVFRKKLDSLAKNSVRNYSSKRPTGALISQEDATAVFKKMVPAASEEDLKFLSAIAIQEVHPEAAWGLFKNGIVYTEVDEAGRIYNKVLRHEIFHKIYAEYLTNKERAELRKELDPNNRLNYVEVEERMAERFEDWKEKKSGSNVLQRLFNKVLRWFNLTRESKLDRVFRQIENGAFTVKSNEPLLSTRNYTTIRKTFGTAARYKEARRLLLADIDRVSKDPSKGPFTFDETLALVKGRFKLGLAGLRAKYDATPSEAVLNNLQLLEIIADDKNFNNLVKDIFPSISSVNATFTAEEIEAMDVDFDEDADGALQQKAVTREDKEFSMRDHTQDAEDKNQESSITAEAKLFLSTILYKDGKGVVQRVHPRFAYFKLLQVLSGVVTDGRSIDNIIEQINQNHNAEGVTAKSKLIVNAVTSLIGRAYSSTFEIGGKLTSLPTDGIFEDKNTYVFSPTGQNLRDSFNYSREVVIKRNGRTDKFLESIAQATGKDIELIKASFKNYQDKQVAIALLSNMTSQRESNPYLGRKENRIKDGGRVMEYFPASTYGKEQKFANYIIDGISKNYDEITLTTWAEIGKLSSLTPEAKTKLVAKVFSELKIDPKRHLQGEQNPALVTNFLSELLYFRKRIEATKKKGKWETRSLSQVEGLEVEDDTEIELNPAYFIELAENRKVVQTAIALMANNTEDYRATGYKGGDGKTKYVYHLSSWGFDLLERLQRMLGTGKQLTGLPEALSNSFLQKNPLVSALNGTPFTVIDHDGVKSGLDYNVPYSSEKLVTWQERKFALGFLAHLGATSRKSDPNLKYVQYLYTISNKPRISGVELELLRENGIRQRIRDMVNQHIERVATDEIDGYNKYKFVNQEALRVAMFDALGTEYADLVNKLVDKKNPGTIQERKKWYSDLHRLENKLSNTTMKKIEDKFMEEIDRMTENFLDSMVLANPELPQNNVAAKAMSSLVDKKYLTLEQAKGLAAAKNSDGVIDKNALRDIAKLWVGNNYVNGFFLNQIVIGDSNFFADAEDVDKRLSGVFAPGVKGIIGKEAGFMANTARVAVANDPLVLGTEIAEFMKNDAYAIFESVKDGFIKYADAQGFITPARHREIVAGFGEAYSAGNVLKPAVYEYREVEVTNPRTGKKEKIVVPFMMKYSAVVLSDDLVAKYPVLKKLRDKMEEKNVGELIMKSGTKVGAPVTRATLDNGDILIPEESVREISNANYRLQLNPKAKPYSKTTHPTQLTYFMNMLHEILGDPKATEENRNLANRVFSSMSSLIDLRTSRIPSFFDKRGKLKKSVIKSKLKSPGDERIAEMLEYLNYNMPHISTKAIIQLAKIFQENSIETKYPGSKFVLQSSWGITLNDQNLDAEEWTDYGLERINTGSNRLQYKIDSEGNMYAEVIMPKVYKDKVALGDYVSGDMLGFRVPSTELHSGIPLKVVGFYDSQETNVIIAPAEVVALHGSDFDVDALYVISRSIVDRDITYNGRTLLAKGTPIGYTLNAKGNYELIYSEGEYPGIIESLEGMVGTKNEDGSEVITEKELFALRESYHKNVIVESFLTMMSKQQNRARMLKPISTERLAKLKDVYGTKTTIDLSDVNGDQDIFLSNFGGRDLTSIMANLTKGIAYLTRAGLYSREQVEARKALGSVESDIRELEKSIAEDIEKGKSHAKQTAKLERLIKERDTLKETLAAENTSTLPVLTGETVRLGATKEDVYDQMQEYEVGTGIPIVDTMDSIVNAAIDNVKEQILQVLNITNYTGKMWAAGVSLGIPLDRLSAIMLQPVMKFSSNYSRNDEDMSSVLGRIRSRLTELGAITTSNKSAAKEILEAVYTKGLTTDEALAKSAKLSSQDFSDLLKGEDVDGLMQQFWIALEVEKLRKIGTGLDNAAKAVSTIQEFDVFYPDIERRADRWNKLGTYIDGTWTANPDFPFEIGGLANTAPHLLKSKEVYDRLLDTIQRNFVIHSPAMEALVAKVSQDMTGLRLGDDQTQKEKLKHEAMHYLISSYYVMDDVEPYTYTGFADKRYTLTGAEAWAQRFLQFVKGIQRENRNKPAEERNEFLDALSIKESNGYLYADFKADRNQTNEELLALLDAFDSLSEAGPKAEGDTFSILQRGLAQYSVIAFGLSFGMKSYSSVIDPRLLVGVSNYISSMAGRISKRVNDAPVTDNWIENFELQLALNNADRLPYIRTKVDGVTREDWKKIVNTELSKDNVDSQGRALKVFAGVDVVDGKKIYYDLKYSNKLIEDHYERDETHFPLYIQQGSGATYAVFKRISGVAQEFVYYKKVGNKNFNKLYDVPTGLITGAYEYKAGSLFNKDLIARAYTFDGVVESVVPPEVGDTISVLLYSDKSVSRYRRAKVISTPNRDGGRFSYKVAYLSHEEVDNSLPYEQEVERYYNSVMDDMAALDITYEEFIEMSKNHTDLVNFKAEIQDKICSA